MDTEESLNYDELTDKFVEQSAKYAIGQVVYYEYTYNKANQIKLAIGVGIIHDRRYACINSVIGNNTIQIDIIAYDIITPKGLIKNVHEVKIGSVAEHILKEWRRRQQVNAQ